MVTHQLGLVFRGLAGRLNVLGFLSRDQMAFSHPVESKVGSGGIAEAIGRFAAWRGDS